MLNKQVLWLLWLTGRMHIMSGDDWFSGPAVCGIGSWQTQTAILLYKSIIQPVLLYCSTSCCFFSITIMSMPNRNKCYSS